MSIDPTCPNCSHFRSEHNEGWDDRGCTREVTGDDGYQYVCICGLQPSTINDDGVYVPEPYC